MVSKGIELMNDSQAIFQTVLETLSKEYDEVTSGKMMSRDGIKYKGKVFAFFHKNQMVFKLGREFEPEAEGIRNYSVLSPFKTKAPLYDWLEIPSDSQIQWESLARKALERMIGQLG
jgi:TfoX/Sxy family transcriptional regulator of competence genes